MMKIAVMLSAVDKMSRVVDQAVNKSIKKFAEFKKASDNISSKAFSFGQSSGAVGLSLAAPLVYATKQAIEFEDVMADVAKVYNFKVGSESFDQFSEQARDLSVFLGKSSNESAALMASLGQGGVEANNLARISKEAGQLAIAFDLSGDIAGDRYTKLKNALNSSWDETKTVTDAINYLSDNQASKASEILEFMAAGGAAVARASKAAGKDLAAMGSYLISVGKSGAEGATIMERFYKGIMKNADTREMFKKSGGGAAGLIAVLQKGANIKDQNKQFEYFKQFGEYSLEIQAMSMNMDQLRNSVRSVGDETSFTDSVLKEFQNRQSTTKGQMGVAWAEFNNQILDFGKNGLPIINDFLQTMKPILKDVSDFMKNNKELVGTIFKVTAGMAAFSLSVSGLSFAFGGILKTFSFLMSVFGNSAVVLKAISTGFFYLRFHTLYSLVPAFLAATKASWAFTVSLLANPIGATIAIIIALGVAMVIAYKKSETFRAVLDGLFEVGKMLLPVFGSLGKILFGIFTASPKMLLEGLKEMGGHIKSIANGGIQGAFNKGYNASLDLSRVNQISSEANNAGFNVMSKLAIPQTGMGNIQRLPSFPSLTPMGTAPKSAPLVPTGSNNKSTFNFSPTINLSGGATKADGERIKNDLQSVFEKSLNQYQVRKERTSYE